MQAQDAKSEHGSTTALKTLPRRRTMARSGQTMLWLVCGMMLGVGSTGCSLPKSFTSNERGRHFDEVEEVGAFDFLRSQHEERAMTAIADAQLSGHRFDVAEEMYLKALEADPDYAPAHIGRARVRFARERPDQALAILVEAEKRCKKSAALLNEKGVALARMNRYDEAIAEVEKAIRLAPKDKGFRTNLAAVLAMNGRYEESLAAYKEVIPAADAHYLVAGVRYAAGDTAASIAELKLAVAEDPRHSHSLAMLDELQKRDGHYDPNVQPVGYVEPSSSCPPGAQR